MQIGVLLGYRAHEPVRGVSLNDAKRYAQWLSEKTGIKYRLPTKAEWLVAAYSGVYDLSDRIPDLDRAAITNRRSIPSHYTPPVFDSVPNQLSIYGLLGSVWEWVSDDVDPKEGEKFGIVIGGSHADEFPDDLTRVPMEHAVTEKGYFNVGFRLARGELNALEKYSPPRPPGGPGWN